ncbi:MAG: PH domain-containing protein [Lachnospiraceae bacterium]|nr:PH domain-containing protein [Lachnospiraceae bacterium]
MAYTEKKRWPFLGLPWTFTKYTVSEEIITVNAGFLKRVENDCYMYKIVDVRLETSLLERIFGLGTVHCFSSDVTDPDLRIMHIKNAKEIKDYILRQSEAERLHRRTLNTQSLDGNPELGSIDSCDIS